MLSHSLKTLGIQINKPGIERVHRVGPYLVTKNMPTVVQFSSLKDKQAILSSGHKLKETGVTVREHVSVPLRHARRKLLEFARRIQAVFLLSSYNYVFTTDAVIQSRRYVYCN